MALSHFLKNGPKALGYHFGQNLIFRLDRYLLAALGGTSQAGIYAVAATPAELIKLPISAAGQFTLLNAARDQIPLRVVAKRAAVAVGVAAVCAAAGAVIVPFLIPIVYGEDFADASPIFLILILAQVLLAPYMIFSRALVGYGGRSSSSVVGVVGVLVLVGSILVLVPAWGAVGCAVAACAAYAAMSLTAVPLCVRASKRQQPRSQ